MLERKVVVGPFQCNCRILVCRTSGDAVIVDPGDESGKIIQAVDQLGKDLGRPVNVRALIHTHAHLDHFGATREVKLGLSTQPRILLHGEDEFLWNELKRQGQMFGIQYEDPLPVDHRVEDEETIQIGSLKFSVLHTPGHSPGSICVRVHEDSQAMTRETVLSGDTLFQGSVGRTDLWGGDQEQMFESIRSRLLTLDGDTRVCPGHGADSTIRAEKASNPFLI